MITLRGRIVYVVSATYPTLAEPSAALRVATRRDLTTQPLGVLHEGRCLPLSPAEVAMVQP